MLSAYPPALAQASWHSLRPMYHCDATEPADISRIRSKQTILRGGRHEIVRMTQVPIPGLTLSPGQSVQSLPDNLFTWRGTERVFFRCGKSGYEYDVPCIPEALSLHGITQERYNHIYCKYVPFSNERTRRVWAALDPAAEARVAVEEARYRRRLSRRPAARSARATRCASSSSALTRERHAAHVSQRWYVRS